MTTLLPQPPCVMEGGTDMHPIHPDIVPKPAEEAARDGSRQAQIRFVREGPVPNARCPHCGGHLDLSVTDQRWRVRNPTDIANRLSLQLGSLEREELHVLVLDTQNAVIEQDRVYQGNLAGCTVRVGELFRRAVDRHAAAIVLVHNHPSGDLKPSGADLILTNDAINAGHLLDIPVLDHVIVGATGFTSLRERGVPFDRLIGGGR